MGDARAELKRPFGYLEGDLGFGLLSFTDEPRAFDNFVARYARPPVEIRITRDRSQLFVDLKQGDGAWHAKEPLLTRLGVPSDRFPTRDGLWSGYAIETQSADLKRHLPLLLDHLANCDCGPAGS